MVDAPFDVFDDNPSMRRWPAVRRVEDMFEQVKTKLRQRRRGLACRRGICCEFTIEKIAAPMIIFFLCCGREFGICPSRPWCSPRTRTTTPSPKKWASVLVWRCSWMRRAPLEPPILAQLCIVKFKIRPANFNWFGSANISGDALLIEKNTGRHWFLLLGGTDFLLEGDKFRREEHWEALIFATGRNWELFLWGPEGITWLLHGCCYLFQLDLPKIYYWISPSLYFDSFSFIGFFISHDSWVWTSSCEVTNCISSQDVMSWTRNFQPWTAFLAAPISCFNNLTFASNVLKEQNTLC